MARTAHERVGAGGLQQTKSARCMGRFVAAATIGVVLGCGPEVAADVVALPEAATHRTVGSASTEPWIWLGRREGGVNRSAPSGIRLSRGAPRARGR